jgi:competence protein ComEC
VPHDRRGLAPADLRMPAVAVGAWTGGLLILAGAPVGLGSVVACAVVLWWTGRRGRRVATGVAVLLAAAAVLAIGLVRGSVVGGSQVAALADQRAVVHLRLQVTSDPVVKAGRFDDFVVLRARSVSGQGRGEAFAQRVPVVVVAPTSWADVRLGSTVDAFGRLAPSTDDRVSAVLSAREPPQLVRNPDPLWRASSAIRTSIRAAVTGHSEAARALVPALVDGDDAGFPDDLADDFRTTGLTHLLAVSGTNLTLVLGFLVLLARWCGVRGRWLAVVAAAGIAGFVLVARAEPSVLRAAAMGAVGLLALGRNGRERGTRGLGVAVLVLLLIDPGLAREAGFALSVLATAGILYLAPGLRDALATWLPRSAAEAVAVPTAAQLACTPVVAALSGQVSLVAVGANLLAAPAVAPTTILGLVGGLAGLVWAPLGRPFGWTAGWCASWIIGVARWAGGLPTAAVGWGTGVVSLALLTGLCLALVVVLPRIMRRRVTGIGCCALLALGVLVPLPTPGWPPRGWVLVACDVGQGDGLVLDAGGGAAVVVDTGPDPAAMDRCLRRLGVDRVPLVVLTHFHADHVDGLPGVLHGRQVDEIDVTSRADPMANVRAVLAEAAGRAVVRVPSYAETRQVGALTLQVLGPVPGTVSHDSGEGDGSGPNNASVALLVEVAGIRVMLAGDVEPDAQRALARAWPGLRVDVLKVPHHGSRYQELSWLLGLGARLAVVSVGADNDYGHPSAETLVPLQAAGLTVLRTDLDGDIAVVAAGGQVRVATR